MGNSSYYGCHFYWLENFFPFWLCVCFPCIHWVTIVDTYRHICSKTRGCCGIKSIFILHIASKTVGIIFKMPSFKGVPREMALTSWLTDLWSNRILFYNKNQTGEMEEANCSPKSATLSGTMSRYQLTSFRHIWKVCFLSLLTCNIHTYPFTCPVPSLPQNLSNKKHLHCLHVILPQAKGQGNCQRENVILFQHCWKMLKIYSDTWQRSPYKIKCHTNAP